MNILTYYATFHTTDSCNKYTGICVSLLPYEVYIRCHKFFEICLLPSLLLTFTNQLTNKQRLIFLTPVLRHFLINLQL